MNVLKNLSVKKTNIIINIVNFILKLNLFKVNTWRYKVSCGFTLPENAPGTEIIKGPKNNKAKHKLGQEL